METFPYVTSEGAVSHNVLYYQPLPITCNQEKFLGTISIPNNQRLKYKNTVH
jgi:hypothetical protein